VSAEAVAWCGSPTLGSLPSVAAFGGAVKEAAQPQAGMKVTPVRADEGDSRACATTPSRLPEIDRFTLRAARRGDREAFDAIVDLYADRLRLLASHLLHDADLTDDALQDTFFNAYRGLSGFGGRSSLGTWLYRITYTVCMGYLRRRKPPGVSFEDAEDILTYDAVRACAPLCRPLPVPTAPMRPLSQGLTALMRPLPWGLMARMILAWNRRSASMGRGRENRSRS